MILVVVATEHERSRLREHDDVEFLTCGIGPIEAAHETARAIAAKRYDCVLNVGIAGGFRERAEVGDAVVVGESVYADLGLEGGGTLRFALVDRVESSGALLAPYHSGELDARVVRGLTSATITATDERAIALEHQFDVDTEAMEGFSVLRAAERAGVPALEIRGISNLVGERTTNGWDFTAGIEAAAAALDAFLGAYVTRNPLA